LLDRSLKEIRTISHLLHPSGLEEAGFSTAARWYAEEFANRSGIQVRVDVADLPERLPRESEIALFRVLQEALANIHRHSRSRSAEVQLTADAGVLSLTVRDYGVGIAQEQLGRFWSSGASGVGLAGMRERMHELGGTFTIDSNADGTSLTVTLPVSQQFSAADA
jgi:signal transduction histidine kinase